MSSFTARKLFQDHSDGELFKRAVALGKVIGWRGLRKFGRNDDVDGTEEMWEYGTARVLPTVGAALSVVSSSANDDSVGTGAQTIRVEGLDSDYAEITEDIIMDGITPVASVGTDWFRVNRAYVLTAGTVETNDGNLDISIGGNEQAFIEASEGQTHQTHFTVPAGHIMLVTGLSLLMGRGSGDLVVESQVKVPGGAWRSIGAIDLVTGAVYNSSLGAVGEPLPEKAELRQKIVYSGTNAEVSSVVHAYLIDTSVL